MTLSQENDRIWNRRAEDDEPKKAVEAVVSLDRLVRYWDGGAGPFAPEEEMWGELLRGRALDLGLRSVWETLPKSGKPMALTEIEQMIEALSRRGVDLAQAHLLVEKSGEPDIYLSVPRAFPDLGIMPLPDPKKVGLLR
jgi:hypothetical protein